MQCMQKDKLTVPTVGLNVDVAVSSSWPSHPHSTVNTQPKIHKRSIAYWFTLSIIGIAFAICNKSMLNNTTTIFTSI